VSLGQPNILLPDRRPENREKEDIESMKSNWKWAIGGSTDYGIGAGSDGGGSTDWSGRGSSGGGSSDW
jgi:hypothetical protein